MNFIEEKILAKGNLDKLKLRFPPENNFNGLSLGHAKSIHLNFGLAKKYNRPCILRFDDTNPSNESDEYTKSMINDIHWLGYETPIIKYTSDYFESLYSYARILIEKGLAYVDFSTSEEIAVMKGTPTKAGINSPYRDTPIDKNIELFESMRMGKFKDGECTLRLKIDMTSSNMLLRDPIAYRIMNTKHHRTGDYWKIYPMYDFAHPISDWIEEITDSLCTLEFEVHKPLYIWILESLGLTNIPEETEFSRLNITYNVMSKRIFKDLLNRNIVKSSDDPRLLTISGLRRKGYTPESIKEFCERTSVTRRDSVISVELLEECLRDDLNKVSNRLMGVLKPIKLTIINREDNTELVEIENNPEDESYGKRMVEFTNDLWIESEDFSLNPDKKYNRLKLGGEVRLKGAYVVKAVDYIVDSDNNIIEVLCEYDPLTKSGMTIDRKIKGTIHWVSRTHGVEVEVRDYNRLFTKENVGSDYLDLLNPESLTISTGVFEKSCKNCSIDNPVNLIRKGYYVLDKDSSDDKLVFNKTVSLKEGFKVMNVII